MARVSTRWKWKTPRTSREWRNVLHMEGLTKALEGYGEAIAETARKTAPYDESPGRPAGKPHYRDNVVVAVHNGKKRATVRVGNTVPHSIFVEFGGGATPAYHTLEGAAVSHGIGTTGTE